MEQKAEMGKPGIAIMLVMASLLLVAAVATPAGAHGGTEVSYPCSDYLRVDHSHPGSYHRGSGIPTGADPWVPCTHYMAEIVTTSWSGGGSSGWYLKPNNAEYGLWRSDWYFNYVDDNTYCYVVRAAARGKVQAGTSETIHPWKYQYHGGQSSCWSG